MYSYIKTMPARTIESRDRFGKVRQFHFPETEITVVPTLAKVHELMWDDFGPICASWRHGWLCPFHPDASRKRITCSAGLRVTNFCNGLLWTESHLPNYPHEAQRMFYLGCVTCYKWAHKLGDAYWNIPTAEFLALPDNPDEVFTWCLHRVYSDSDWYEWVRQG